MGIKMLNEIIIKGKSSRDKRSLGFVNKEKTPTSNETTFIKA